jgi:5'-3' exonuclease
MSAPCGRVWAVGGGVLLAIDGNSLVHRAFHSQAATGLRTADGRPRWAVRGLLTQLVAAVERIGPDAVLVGFDDPVRSLRREQWPGYKAHRADKLDSLVEQLAAAAEVLAAMGVAVVVPDGLEADDVLASASRQAAAAGNGTVIVTSDRDAFALIDEHTRVLRIINGGVDASPLLTPERLVSMIGIRPEQYPDYAALRGDPSDNLPGARGIGPKTAACLLAALGSVPAAFEDLDSGGGRVERAVGAAAARRLADPAARQAWTLNRQVMLMRSDVPLGLGGGRGGLPLASEPVRAAFAVHALTWSTTGALRALCRDEAPRALCRDEAPVAATPPPELETVGRATAPWDGYGRRRPLPRLVRRTRTGDQLALF